MFLKLATHFVTATTNHRLLWQAIAVEALAMMPNLHPRIGPRLMEAVATMETSKSFRADYQMGWYGSAIEALRQLEPPGLAAWLGARALSDKQADLRRTSTALTALGGMADQVPGRTRHGIAKSIMEGLGSIARRSAGNFETANLMRDMVVTLQRLAAAAGPEADVPDLGMLTPDDSLRGAEQWWRRHSAPDDPLWR